MDESINRPPFIDSSFIESSHFPPTPQGAPPLSPVLAFAATGGTTLDAIKDALADFAKDTRLNLGSILTPEGAPDLSEAQIAGVALAVAYALATAPLTEAVEAFAAPILSPAQKQAAKTAASLMAMNNIYYRFVHALDDAALTSLPAKLRMQGMATHGIEKVDFELMSLAVSAVNGCGMCMDSHARTLMNHGLSALGVQSSVRIAAVLHAVKASLAIPA